MVAPSAANCVDIAIDADKYTHVHSHVKPSLLAYFAKTEAGVVSQS
jgi:hypothetical protein